MARRSSVILILFCATLLVGCWSLDRPAAESTAMNAAPSVAPPTPLAGKWTLATPGAGSCVMNFGAQPDATEGTIAPAGGCTSRKWSYITGGLVIRDHKAETLAQLSPVGPDTYEGRTSDGQEVTLSRQ
jgi:Protease inhibitor Inh